MKGMESEKSHSWLWDSHISPKNTKWLAENLKEVDQSVKAMLKLIEEDGDSFANKAGMHYERKPELIAHVEGFYRMYSLLAEHCDHLTGELRKNVPSVFQMQNSHSSSGQDSPLNTPDQKLGLNKFGQQAVGFDLFLSSGGGSSNLSLKEGSESSSSVSDSESESFDSSINKHSNPHVTSDGKRLYQKIIERETQLPTMKEKVELTKKENADDELEVQENGDYATLIKTVTKYEEEMKELNKTFQLSEEEVARLKGELKKNEDCTLLIGDLQAQLESAQRDLKMGEADLEMEKTRVLKLQREVAELETQVSNSSRKIGTLVNELEIAREKLKVSEDEVSVRDQEIKDLDVALRDTQKAFSLEKAKLQSVISIISEQLALIGARVEESELRSRSLENEIRQCEAVKKEMKCLHEAQEISLWREIERLKADIAERDELMEDLNKNLDMLKLKHDVLNAENDRVSTKVQKLIAEMSSRDNQIQQLEEHVRQMHIECVELIVGGESARELVDELRLRVGELEKELDRQRVMITDRAEEKREAIRQLCFSLEHYRNGYQELRQAFIGHKRHAILAS